MICDSVDKLVNKGFALLVYDLDSAMLFLHVIHDSVKQVSLTKTRMTVNEEGIAVCGIVCHRVADRLCKLI